MNYSDWIADCLAGDPPRSKSLVVTIFGDAIVPHGGMVWLGSLIITVAALASARRPAVKPVTDRRDRGRTLDAASSVNGRQLRPETAQLG